MAGYDLLIVKQLAQKFKDGDKDALWFSAPTRSTYFVAKIFACSEEEAKLIIADGILKLRDADYHKKGHQWGDATDIYGLENYGEHNWFIKFILSDDDGVNYVEEISFHPNDKPLVLIDGRILNVTYQPQENAL